MTTLENTISMMEVLPEADLLEIQKFTTKLFKQRRTDCPFLLKSREDIYKDLEISRKQAEAGEYQEAGEFMAELREEYGI